MKPSFEAVNPSGRQSFLVRRFEEIRFSAPYHFHPEYELTLIVAGSGKRYVGTHMASYGAGDLVLLGPNLPHCWKTDLQPAEKSVSVVVQFRDDFMGPEFLSKPELAAVAQLLQRSAQGLRFGGDTGAVQNGLLALAQEHEPFKKLLLLLQILQSLSSTHAVATLDAQSRYPGLPPAEKERIRDVVAYIVEHFQEKILLKDAATVAHMSAPAFCNYFKRMTRKTFIEAVTDYRIDFAVQQLVHTDKPITQIGLDSGFDDSSNFYKTFKRRMKQSPLRYRNAFAKTDG